MKEAKAEGERVERLASMSDERAAAIRKCRYEDRLEDMPDCEIKFRKIQDTAKDPKWKFTDSTFSHAKAEQKVLGDAVFQTKSQR